MSETSKTIFFETWSALLMSLTALVTAWSAYQANLWTGIQAEAHTRAIEAQMIETKDLLSSRQQSMLDGIISLEVAKAFFVKDITLANFITSRVRKDLADSITSWIALDPINNQNAPRHPLLMPEYLKNVVEKDRHERLRAHNNFKKKMLTAKQSGSTSDSYVLLTVLFAAVLFFAGIASSFKVARVHYILLGTSSIILLLALAILLGLPVAVA